MIIREADEGMGSFSARKGEGPGVASADVISLISFASMVGLGSRA